MVGLTSAAGLLGFLAEPDPQLKTYALEKLNEEVDILWPEIADNIGPMSVQTFRFACLPLRRVAMELPILL